jgi:antibiotic biosynthesis monooxygenase (ABM) superfamily enzyme
MKRRDYLKTMLAGGASVAAISAFAAAPNPIVLEVDLAVDPSREKEMLDNFHKIFKPAAVKFPGYIDVKILKLRSALMGQAPAGLNYRFQLVYQSEELRQKWVASDVHQKAWPTIEKTLSSKDYRVLLFDVA